MKSKSQGGLGVRNLGEVNASLLLKWWWRFSSEDKALQKSVVCSKYGRLGGAWIPLVNQIAGVSMVWRDITQITESYQQLDEFFGGQLKIIVGNGR